MPIRLAICDDNDTYRTMLRLVLGLESDIELVGEASDGNAAIELVTRERPDVLLLDLAMPKMDGLEALPLIREASPATDVIMLTGFTSTNFRNRATALGAAEYLEKGCEMRVMLDTIRDKAGAHAV
jgi:DNA-binding NarL/FixJ family response regulator